MKLLRIATRQSQLALWQANWVKSQLESDTLSVELIGITTQGDKTLDQSLSKIGGKGLFVKELEQALLTGRADLAVHSLKDMPMDLPEGLVLQSICEREDPRDVLITQNQTPLSDLPSDCIIGTSSFRRQNQIRQLKPQCALKDLRGNVDTRLKKCLAGDFDGIILAAAGMHRLRLENHITSYFSTDEFLPAAGQGAIGLECRSDDPQTQTILKTLHHMPTFYCVSAERAVIKYIGGDCTTPIAAFATLSQDTLTLKAIIGTPDGKKLIKTERSGPANQAQQLGMTAANDLIERGAHDIIAALG